MKESVSKNEATEIDLLKLFTAYLRRWWLIVLCALIVGGGAVDSLAAQCGVLLLQSLETTPDIQSI